MARTFESYQLESRGYIKDKDPDTLQRIKDWINAAIREIWNAHDWDFKQKRLRLNTVGVYETGTATVTQGDTAVSGAGGAVWTGKEGYKFASSITEPWSLVESASAAGLTLDVAFAEESLSASAYVLFKDWFELDDDIDEIISIRYLRGNLPALKNIGLDLLERYQSMPSHQGRPDFWYLAPRVDNTKNIVIGLWPIPDDIYPVEIRYNRALTTNLTQAAQTSPLPDDFDPLIIAYVLEQAATYDYLDNKSILAANRFEKLLARKIKQNSAAPNTQTKFQPFDSQENNTGFYPNKSQYGDWY